MNITDIRIFAVKGNTKLKAKCNVTVAFDNGWQITIKAFRIHDDGIVPAWIGVPTERYEKNGKPHFSEMVWFNQAAQSDLYPKILEKYKQQQN